MQWDRLSVKTSTGSDVVVDASALAERAGERLIVPDHAAYDDARRVWNGMIDKRPAPIARCRGVSDVIDAVRFAREHELLVAVRGGGHNVAGFATCDGGLVIDLSAMNAVRVEPDKRRARAEGGATLGDLDRETQAFALAAPGGVVSTTGIAGLTLGGGQGWLRRTYGMAWDSLVSVDVVTADGRLLTAREDEHADLFWAVRGGGGNFGVVTSFEYRMYPVGPTVAFAGPVYPADIAPEIVSGFRDFMAEAPDAINATTVYWQIPAVAAFPEAAHGKDVVVLGAVYAGAVETGERLLEPLRKLGETVFDMSSRMSWLDLQRMFDPFYPARELHYYWKSIYLDGLSSDVIDALDRRFRARPSPISQSIVWALGGAMDRVGESASAVGRRGAPFVLEILANWTPGEDDEPNIAWARELYDEMRPFSSGKPNVNFPGLGEDAGEFVRAAYGDNYERLVAAKKKYDPTNLFRLNQNIDPGA